MEIRVMNSSCNWNRLFYGKLSRKKGQFFKNIVTNAREFAHLTETLKQKCIQKPKESKYIKKENPAYPE
jgi:hypothetical protein